MWLHRQIICEILNLTEVDLFDKIKKRGKKFASLERIVSIEKELCENTKNYFEGEGNELEINSKCLRQCIRTMISSNSHQKIAIGKSPTSAHDLNMTTESVDLDSSSMSIDIFDDENLQPNSFYNKNRKELILELAKANQIILNQQAELNDLRPLGNIFGHEQKRGAFSYGKRVDNVAVSLLCQGETSYSISRFFETLCSEFPVLLQSSDLVKEKSFPKNSYINSLRDCLPIISTLQLSSFLDDHATDGKKLILTVDQTTISDNVGIMGMGIVNNLGHHHSIGLVESNASKSLDISSDMRNIIQKTGFSSSILENTVGIMSDRCAAQLAANRDFTKNVYDEMNVSIAQLNCFMHSVSNIEKKFCDAFDLRVPEVKTALHKLKLIYGGRKSMGYQRNSLKQTLADISGGSKTSIFLSDLGSRFGIFYNNSLNVLNHKDAVLESLHNCKKNNTNANDLNMLIKNNWNLLALGFGSIVMFWAFIISPFNSATTRKSTLRETQEIIQLTNERLELIRDTTTPFEQLYSFRFKDDK
jgi:hypothetical protein